MHLNKKHSYPREKLDWHRSIEERGEFTGAFFPLPNRITGAALAASSVLGLIQKDIDSENAMVQRCPKCNHHTFRKLRPGEKTDPDGSNWRCSRCGNETDEFGNKL